MKVVNALLIAQFGPIIERHLETSQLREKARSLNLLYEIGSKLSSIRDENQLLDSILEPFDGIIIALL